MYCLTKCPFGPWHLFKSATERHKSYCVFNLTGNSPTMQMFNFLSFNIIKEKKNPQIICFQTSKAIFVKQKQRHMVDLNIPREHNALNTQRNMRSGQSG